MHSKRSYRSFRAPISAAAWLFALWATSGTVFAAETLDLFWHDDYGQARQAAEREGKLLFILFHEEGKNPARDAFLENALPEALTSQRLERFVFAQVPMDAPLDPKESGDAMSVGKSGRIIDHPSFQHMLGRQGIAIVDLSDAKSKHFGNVISEFPFSAGKYYTAGALATILDLPPGSLTQRTLVYAVRRHGERPKSTHGQHSPLLMAEAGGHSSYQASIGVQGHQNFDGRANRVMGAVGGMVKEVVAESWPGQTLVEAAHECIASWRQSSGHWAGVAGRHTYYGYDMKRGANGVWYATGLFAN